MSLILFRQGPLGRELPGAYFRGRPLDVSSLTPDYDERFFNQGGFAWLSRELERTSTALPELPLPRLAEGERPVDGETLNRALPSGPFSALRLGAPVARPSKLIAVGLNYRDHAEETGAKVPRRPMLFMKATTAISGVYDDLAMPPHATALDHEVELALVIGKQARCVEVGSALDHVAGYTICNDYSERDWQKNHDGQFVKGKSYDGFAPLGPFLVQADMLDPSDLGLELSVNGEVRQSSRTSQMIFGVPELVSAISSYMTLLPGDVITTGTPAGVGLGRTPPLYLKPGDLVHYRIDGLGAGLQRLTTEARA